MKFWKLLKEIFGFKPTPAPPPRPDRHWIHVHVEQANGVGIAAVIVRLSDPEGLFTPQVGVTNVNGDVGLLVSVEPYWWLAEVTKDGFKPFSMRVLNTDGDVHVVVTLEPVKPEPFPVSPILAGFCSHKDRKGRVVFDAQYFPHLWWRWKVHGDSEARDDFFDTLERKRRAGITCVVFDPPDGGVYDADWVRELPDWMDGGGLHPFFEEMVDAILERGFAGIFYCYGGGQTDAVHIYNGQLQRMLERIAEKGWVPRLAAVLWAWESYGITHECTARQNVDAWRLIWRICGPDVRIGGHVDGHSQRFTYYPEPYEADCPVPKADTGEIDAWYVADMVKFHFHQLPYGRGGPARDWQPRFIEGCDRFFPTGHPLPAIGSGEWFRDQRSDVRPYAIGPYWFGAPRAAGPMEVVLWEHVPFGYIRGEVSDETVRRLHEEAVALGVEHFGCMPA